HAAAATGVAHLPLCRRRVCAPDPDLAAGHGHSTALAVGPQGGVFHPGLAGLCHLVDRPTSLWLARTHGRALAVCRHGLAAAGLCRVSFRARGGAQARHPPGSLTMLKFLLLILLVALIWWLWPRRSPGSDRTEGRKGTPTRPRGTPAQPPLREPDIIVECAQCGLHLPQAE